MDDTPKFAYVKCERCGAKVRVAADTCMACAKPEELFTCPVCPELREEAERLRKENTRLKNGLEAIATHASWQAVLCRTCTDDPDKPDSKAYKCLAYVGEVAMKLLEKYKRK